MESPLVSLSSDMVFERSLHIAYKDKIYLRQEFFSYLNSLHLEGRTLISLQKEYGIRYDLIKKAFIKYGLKRLSQEETNRLISRNVKESLITKYGVSSPALIPGVKNKIKNTCIDRYGTDNPFSNKDIQRKCVSNKDYDSLLSKTRCTTERKYGVEHILSSPEIQKKIKNTLIDRYGVSNIFSSKEHMSSSRDKCVKDNYNKVKLRLKEDDYEILDDYKGLMEKDLNYSWKIYKIKCLKCDSVFEDDVYLNPKCLNCFKSGTRFSSKQEKYYSDFLTNDLKVEHSTNSHPFPWIKKEDILSRKFSHEVDIFIPEKRMGFEINGLYTHASGITPRFRGSGSLKEKSTLYHQDKTMDALDAGISLYHIWEDDNPDIIKSLISSKLGVTSKKIFARKLVFEEISSTRCRDFLQENHLHGFIGATRYFALHKEDEIFAAMSFINRGEGVFEIQRFASKLSYSIPGGFSKILKHSLSSLEEVSTLLSYAYVDWSPNYKNTVYYKYGFSYEGITSPRLLYFNKRRNVRESRQKYQKHKLKKLFPESYSDSLTANQILSKESIYPIYDSGNHKFIYSVK